MWTITGNITVKILNDVSPNLIYFPDMKTFFTIIKIFSRLKPVNELSRQR